MPVREMVVTELEWDNWFPIWRKRWRQGQHATLIGPTGCGKTVLGEQLTEAREGGYVVAFGTKPEDDSMAKLQKQGWHRVEKWPPPQGDDRVLLWPKIKDPQTLIPMQQRVFAHAFNEIYKVGRWCIWLDELYYMTNALGLRRRLQVMYTHARSLKISLLGSTQRPAWVPLETYNQAGHLIMFRTGDEGDLRKLGSINGMSSRMVADIVGQLENHEFLHVDLIKQTLMVSRYNPKERKG